ncbi:MAG: PCRF domain-containing protein, partial [Candidatus Phytoplasma australasiaticum]|nr:PCRF domain-containing protein [Candidatus Phytoplasma australasiaticum]MDV3175406.1 PCRF domain-containing protein [Candidatus Phytoplasma australasiaticum]
EANLFVSDLFRAYKKYIEYKKWKLENGRTSENLRFIVYIIE